MKRNDLEEAKYVIRHRRISVILGFGIAGFNCIMVYWIHIKVQDENDYCKDMNDFWLAPSLFPNSHFPDYLQLTQLYPTLPLHSLFPDFLPLSRISPTLSLSWKTNVSGWKKNGSIERKQTRSTHFESLDVLVRCWKLICHLPLRSMVMSWFLKFCISKNLRNWRSFPKTWRFSLFHWFDTLLP